MMASLLMVVVVVTELLGYTAAASSYIDITVPVTAGLPVFQQADGLPKNWRSQHQVMDDGDVCNQSFFMLDAHTGTHVDAPAHFIKNGNGIETLDLDALIARVITVAQPHALWCTDYPMYPCGKTLVVDFPVGSNITEDALKKLQLPAEAERVLFKTDNSAKRLMFQRKFASNYTSLDSTGAAYITQHTNVKLIGIDYLSIGCLEDIIETHRILLGKPVIAVEGLDLTAVEPGWYHQLCLPAKFQGSDGAPIRCLLQQLHHKTHTEL